jgi:hypothetical protein
VDEPVELEAPLLNATASVAPAQAAGRLLTVTLTTLPALRLLITPTGELVHRGVVTRAAPRDRDV